MGDGLNIQVWEKSSGCAQSVVQKKKIQKLQDIAITAEQRWMDDERGVSRMEKKYIVELYDENVKSVDGYNWLKLLISVADKPVMVETAIELLPYAEPDTEKVMEEAYKTGYDAACKDIDIKSKTNAAYQKGLEDVWETVKKLFGYTFEEKATIFKTTSVRDIARKYSASEAIEKIRQYEKEQRKIQVGDEVTDDKGDTGVCTEISYPANSMHIMYADGTATDISLTGVTQTGRHFPEIAEVLAKMKE